MRKNVVVAAACTVVILGAGAASAAGLAGPVDSSGVVHGCLTTAAVRGSHAVVLQDAGTACPRGTTAIQWNQQGPQGVPGTAGHDGAAGKDGATVLNGAGAPADSVGHDGDFYLDTANTVLYGPRASGAWPTPGKSLVGPQGAAGTPGASGAQAFALVVTPAIFDSQKLFNDGDSMVEGFCSGGASLVVQNGNGPNRGPSLLVTGSVSVGSGSDGRYDIDGSGGNPLPVGAVAASTTRFELTATAGLVTGQLLVTQGSSTFTVAFSLVGGNTQGCVVSAQVTPTS